MICVDSQAGAALAVVAGQRRHQGVAVPGNVVVVELVDAAYAVADDGGALGIQAGDLGDQLGLDPAGMRGPLQAVLLDVALEQLELGDALNAFNGVAALERGPDSLSIVQCGPVAAGIPNVGHLDLGLRTVLSLDGGHLAEHLAGLRVDQEGEGGVLEQVLALVELLVEDVLGHAQEVGRVRAGAQVDPDVCLGCGGGKARVEHDHLGACRLCVEEAARPHHAGLEHVAVCQNDHLGLRPLPDGVEREHAGPREGSLLAVSLAHVVAVHGAGAGTQDGAEQRCEAL